MAVFNPTIAPGKDNMPDWTKVTSPTSGGGVDRSTGIALATVGETIGDAAGILDTTMKDVINKDVRSTVEKTREEYTNDLLAARDYVQGKANQNNTGAPLNLLPQDQAGTVPAGIESGLRRVDKIQNMLLTGSGKIAGDDTYYDMRLKNDVTALRSRYPGYVDYIDQRVAAITGMNPANETIKDLTRSLAQLQTTRKTEQDKWLDIARKAIGDGLGNSDQVKNANTMYKALTSGQISLDTYQNWYYEENAKRANLEDKAKARAAMQGDKADREDQWHKDYQTELSTQISTNMNTILSVTGMKVKNTMMGFIKDAAENPGKYNDVQLRQFSAYIGAQQAAAEATADATAARQQKDGQSYNSIVESSKLATAKKNIITNYYESIRAALDKGNAGLAFQNAVRAKALVDLKTDEVYSGPAGQDILLLKVIEGAMGGQWAATVSSQAMNNNVDKSINKLFQANVLSGKAGSQVNEANPTGKQPTYKGMADQILSVEQSGRINQRMRSRYLQEGFDVFYNDIIDPKAPDSAKVNALKFFFSKDGQDILKNFKDDYYDSSGKVFYPGKQTLWGKLSSDKVIAEVNRLSASDSSIKPMYRNWMEKEAGAQLYIKDMLNLNGFVAHNNDVQIHYNDGDGKTTPFIILKNAEGNDLSAKDMGPMRTSQAYFKKMVDSVGRVNEALAGMDRVYRGTGNGNASDMLLNLLQQSNVDFGKGWTGLPKDLIEAMVAARGKGKLKEIMTKGVTE